MVIKEQVSRLFKLIERNGITSGVSEATMRNVIYIIAIKELNDIEDVVKALRGVLK